MKRAARTAVSPLYVLLTIGLEGAALLFMRFWQEERQKSVLRGAFSRYVAPEVVERILRLRGDIFAGEEVEATVMFTDIPPARCIRYTRSAAWPWRPARPRSGTASGP